MAAREIGVIVEKLQGRVELQRDFLIQPKAQPGCERELMVVRNGRIALQAEADIDDEVCARGHTESELDIQKHGNAVGANALAAQARRVTTELPFLVGNDEAIA